MLYKCIACKDNAFQHFFNKEKALEYLLELNDDQKDVFIHKFKDYDLMTKLIMFYKETPLEIDKNSIYYKDHYLNIYSY